MRSSSKILALSLGAAVLFTACGKSNSTDTTTTNTTTPTQAVTVNPPTPSTYTYTSTSTTTSTGTGSSPLSYEISLYGGSAVYTTNSIPTDNILQVRFETGPAGNQVFDATDLRVEISVNGTTRVPKYTSDPACPAGGCEYGRPSDGPSTVLDFSGSLSPGIPVVVSVTQARYNWYCYTGLYPGSIPQYDSSQPCNYRLVLDPFNNGSQSSPGHYWKGRLIIATSATNLVQFNSSNP